MLPAMTDATPQNNEFAAAMADLRQLRDEVRLKLHLAGMDARSAWEKLEPSIAALEQEFEQKSEVVAQSLHDTVLALRARLRALRQDLER